MEGPSRSRWPMGLLGMLTLVALVETGLSRHPLRFTETATLSWRLAVEAIPREASRCEVACLGDSLVKIGVIPEVVREGSGRSTYNFAMAQAPAPATYFLLRRLLDSGAKPSAIVVGFKPSILSGGPRFSLQHWQSILDARECLELARDTRSVGILVELALGRLLPSYRDRLEIRKSIRSALDGEISETYSTNLVAIRNWGKNQGAHLNSSRASFSGEIGPDVHKKLLSDAWQCHRINATYIDRLLTLADSRSVPVYWLIPPLPPQLQERRENSGVDTAYLTVVRSMQAKHPTLTVIDGRRAGYDSSTFADHSHLNGRGSIAMSHEVGRILRRPRDHSRWIALPQFRDWTPASPLEDVDQSRIALEAEVVRR